MGNIIDKSDLFKEKKRDNEQNADMSSLYKKVAISLDALEKAILDTEEIIMRVNNVLGHYGESEIEKAARNKRYNDILHSKEMTQKTNMFNSTNELINKAYIASDIVDAYDIVGKIAYQDLLDFLNAKGIELDDQPKSVL